MKDSLVLGLVEELESFLRRTTLPHDKTQAKIKVARKWLQSTKTETYPKKTDSPDVIQYDENVFVWLDETGNAGGAATNFEDASNILKLYGFYMQEGEK